MVCQIDEGPRADGVRSIVRLHADYYSRAWGFGGFFEQKVASEAAAFFERYSSATDRAWFVVNTSGVVGSLIIDGVTGAEAHKGAHLRWFVIEKACRGTGLGHQLMQRACAFCDDAGYQRTYLTTFAGLDAARALYEYHGFHLIEEADDATWGVPMCKQVFERHRQTTVHLR